MKVNKAHSEIKCMFILARSPPESCMQLPLPRLRCIGQFGTTSDDVGATAAVLATSAISTSRFCKASTHDITFKV